MQSPTDPCQRRTGTAAGCCAEQLYPNCPAAQCQQRHIQPQRAAARPHSQQKQAPCKQQAESKIQHCSEEFSAVTSKDTQYLVHGTQSQSGQQSGRRFQNLCLDPQFHGVYRNIRAQKLRRGWDSS